MENNKTLYDIAKGSFVYQCDEAIQKDKAIALVLQQRLANFGLLTDPDGAWGPKSAAALERFKKFRSLKEKGLGAITAKELINTAPENLIPGYKLEKNLASRVLMFLVDNNLQVSLKPGECNIVYLQGVSRDGTINTNRQFCFNDRRLIIKFDSVGGIYVPKLSGNWLATCDPGDTYWYSPMNPKGCASILGRKSKRQFAHFKAWKTGRHKDQYALVQAAEITVLRGENETPDTGDYFGVNQHTVAHGLSYSLEDPIHGYSAGCAVGADRKEHDKEFMTQVDADPREKANKGRYLHVSTFIRGNSLEYAFPIK